MADKLALNILRARQDNVVVLAVDISPLMDGTYMGQPDVCEAWAQEVVEYLIDALPGDVFARVCDLMWLHDRADGVRA